MTRVLQCFCFFILFSMCGFSQPILFHFPKGFLANATPINAAYVQIHQNDVKSQPVFIQKLINPLGKLSVDALLIGNNNKSTGNIDSVFWSEGDFWLNFTLDSIDANKTASGNPLHFRSETDLLNDHEEGTINEDQCKNGLVQLPNTRGVRPRKIMLDLSTNYVNLDYPADTYPIYRHYEWFDAERDGIGNAFMLTYSDKTTHEAWIHTNKIGDVKLYERPFQEIFVRQLDGVIKIELTKSEIVRHLNIDYALKGPWKLIYYIEW